MSRRSKIDKWSWSPSFFGKIISGSKPNWTVWVKNEGTETVGADVTLYLHIPLIGGTVRDQKVEGHTGAIGEGGVTSTGPMATDFTNAAPGYDPYTIYAVPQGGGDSDTRTSTVVVVRF